MGKQFFFCEVDLELYSKDFYLSFDLNKILYSDSFGPKLIWWIFFQLEIWSELKNCVYGSIYMNPLDGLMKCSLHYKINQNSTFGFAD